MDDLFPLLMLLVFVLGPIIEGLKRKNRQNPPPPTQRRMPPRAPERQLPRQQQPSRMEEVSTRPREETAAGMVPEDLWEILTGQKRPPVLTTPQPAPPAERKRQQWDVVFDPDAEDEKPALESVAAEDVNVETRRGRVEAQSRETLERHPVPVVVSLEDNLPTVAQRHQAFHKKIAAPVPVVAKPRSRRRLALTTRSELQRAFLWHDVLGKPKGLE